MARTHSIVVYGEVVELAVNLMQAGSLGAVCIDVIGVAILRHKAGRRLRIGRFIQRCKRIAVGVHCIAICRVKVKRAVLGQQAVGVLIRYDVMARTHGIVVCREVVELAVNLLQSTSKHAIDIGILRPVAGHDAVFSIDPLMGVAVKDVIHRGIIVAGCYIIHAADGITGAVEEIRLPVHLAQLVFHHRAGPIVAQAVCGIVPAATEQPAVLAEQITHQGGAQLHLAGHRIVDPIAQGAHVIHVVFGSRHPTRYCCANPNIEQSMIIAE